MRQLQTRKTISEFTGGSVKPTIVKSKDRGQAMVEFVILLIIFMALIAGQIYAARLALFDYWAQQEARFIAYEQMEAPAAAGQQAFQQVEQGDGFQRPSLVSGLSVDREIADIEDIRDLILSQRIQRSADGPLGDQFLPEQAPTYLASRKRSGFELVPSAYARQNSRELSHRGAVPRMLKDLPLYKERLMPHTELDDRIQFLLDKGQVGEQLCDINAAKFVRGGFEGAARVFEHSACAPSMDRAFAVHLTNHLDIRELTRDFSDRLDWGDNPQSALESSVRQAIARGYYSFFDTVVETSASLALVLVMITERGFDVSSEMATDPQFVKLLSELRYLGSIVAENAVAAGLVAVNFLPGMSQSVQQEKDILKNIQDILHIDGKDTLGGVGYMLGPEYLPFTSIMLEPMYGGILNAVMENVLSKDDDLAELIMDQSNRETVITYDAGKGLFPGAVKRFRTGGVQLTSRHYLVTQSWEIPRRTSPDGMFRELGSENDDYSSSDSDEAILKRRVVGLWLIPSNPVAFLTPVADLVGGAGIGGLFSENIALTGFSEGIELLSETAKDFICDNPLNDFMGWLEALPGFNASKFTLPACPAVRPAAYPFTSEIKGDKTTGIARDFNDFLKEQRESNPIAWPEYHEDSATTGGGQDDQGAEVCGW